MTELGRQLAHTLQYLLNASNINSALGRHDRRHDSFACDRARLSGLVNERETLHATYWQCECKLAYLIIFLQTSSKETSGPFTDIN